MLRFFEENCISLQLSDMKVIEQCKSEQSSIELYEHRLLGKVLIINNEIQHIEAWHSLYHENVVHIPVNFIPVLKTALILGGGSFFAARELVKYKSLERLVMVDYDHEVIRIVSSNYGHISPILSDKRFTLITDDIFEYLNKTENKFDLIVNDAIDILDYDKNLYDTLGTHLSEDGVCSDVIYRHIFEGERCQKTINELRSKYHSAFSLITIPEYPGILHLLSMWSRNSATSQHSKMSKNKEQQGWLLYNKVPCEIFSPQFIAYYLHLPPYLKKWVNNI